MALQNITGFDPSKPLQKVEIGSTQNQQAQAVDYSQPYQKIEYNDAGELQSDSIGTILTKAVENIPSSFRRAAAGLQKSSAEMPERVIQDITGINQRTGELEGPGGVLGFAKAVPDFVSSLVIDQIMRGSDQTYADSIAEADATIAAENAAIAQNQPYIRDDATTRRWLSDNINSIVQNAPGMGASMLLRRSLPALAQGGGMSYADSYIEQRQAGMSPSDSADAAMGTGIAEVAFGKMPLDYMLSKGKGFTRKVIGSMVGEGLSEGMTAAVQEGIRMGTVDPNMTFEEYLSSIGYQASLGAGSGATFGTVTAGLDKVTGADKVPGESDVPPPPPQDSPEQSLEEYAIQENIQLPQANDIVETPSRTQALDQQVTPAGDVPYAGEKRTVSQQTPEPGSVAEMRQVLDNPQTPIEQITASNDGYQLIDVDNGEGTNSQGQIWYNPETGDFREYSEGKATPVELPEAMNRLGAEVVREGTKTAPVIAETADDIRVAESNTNIEPSEAQKSAGNYQKGHLKLQGMDITIENPKGSIRRGIDPSGNPWETTLPATYGYVKRTKGADGDHVDVYVGENPQSQEVFVIDQIDPVTKKFDEHKVMLGFDNQQQAAEAYLAAFSDGTGRAHAGGATRMRVDEFRDWLANGKTTEPLSSNANALQTTPQSARPITKQPKQRGGQRGPKSLLQFISSKGGIRDVGGNVTAMNGNLWHRQGAFRRKLINNETGKSLDDLALSAWENGYFPQFQTRPDVNQLLDAIENELRGSEVYTQDDRDAIDSKNEADAAAEEEATIEAQNRIVDHATSLGIDVSQYNDLDEVVDAMVQDLARRADGLTEDELVSEYKQISDDIDAFTEGKYPDSYSVLKTRQDTESDIPFGNEQDSSSISAQSETNRQTEQDGDNAEESKRQAATQEPGKITEATEPDSQQKEKIQPLNTDQTDQGEQTVIPGAERISDKQLAERKMAERKKSNKPQKEADEGLFDTGARAQGDLLASQTQISQTRTKEIKKDVNDTNVADLPEETDKSQNISDFGEKIGGARKDVWESYKDSIESDLPDDIRELTIGKHLPEPAYDKMLEDGVSVEVLATLKAIRDIVPPKPRKEWKLKEWVSNFKAARNMSNAIMNGTLTAKNLTDAYSDKRDSFGRRVDVDLKNRIELYTKLGYPAFTKAKGYSIRSGSYSTWRGQNYNPPKTMYVITKDTADRFGNIVNGYETLKEAEDALRKKLLNDDSAKSDKKVKLGIYRDTRTGDIYIAKKVAANKYIDLKRGFDSPKSARQYLLENEDALLAELEKRKDIPPVRRSANDPRVGTDYRKGENVSPEVFSDTFQFRGVEFGNYVEQKRRAQDLNNAYDGLLDLANLINVPSQAISLNGTLGLAFGARGYGGKNAAAAHYEPGKVVINLTKREGAGSLGHEWWHAFDNNIGKRQEGREYLSSNPSVRKVNKDGTVNENPAIRPELVDRFNDLMKAIKSTELYKRAKELDKTRTKDYWSLDHEVSARAFESYLIHKAAQNEQSSDYLANVLSQGAFESFYGENTYPYPTDAEIRDVIAPAFDKLFKELKHEKTPQGVVLYQRTNRQAEGEVGVRVKRTTEWNSKKQRIANRAKRLAVQQFGTPLKLRFMDYIKADDGTFANGLYFAGRNEKGQLENISLIAMRQNDPSGTIASMGHEGIHFLREMGALDTVWTALSRKAESEWIEKYGIRDLYKGASESLIVEEAIAEAYADYLAGRISVTGKIKALFDRITEFFVKMRDILSNNGITKEADIFERIYKGDFAVKPTKQYTTSNTSVKHAKVNEGSDVPQYTVAMYDNQTNDYIGGARYYQRGDAEVIIEAMETSPDLIGRDVDSALLDHIKKKANGRPIRFNHIPERLSKIEKRIPEISYRFQKSNDQHQNADKMEFEYGDQSVFKALFDQNKSMWDRIKEASSREAVQGSIDNARMLMQDRFLGFNRVQQVIERHTGKPLDNEMNVYKRQELFSGRAGDKLEQLNHKHIDPLTDSISDYAAKHTANDWRKAVDQIEDYLYAQHAKERNEQIAKINDAFPDAGSGMSTDEAKKIIEKAEKNGTKKDLDAIAVRIRSMLDYQLKIRVDMGLMDEKSATQLKDKYPNYVPLRGIEEMGDIPDSLPNTGKGFSIKGEESRRAMGRETKAQDILANAISIAEEAMIRGEKNRVTESLRKLVEANPNQKLWEINKVERVRVLNKATGLVEYRAKPMTPGTTLDKRTVYGKNNGEPYRITINDPRLYEVIKNLDVDKLDGAWKALMAINRYLSHTHTGWNPEFIITNAFRDLQTGVINLQQYDHKKLARNTLRDYPKALLGAWYGVRGKEASELPKWLKKSLKKEGVAADKVDGIAEEWVNYFREFAASGGKVSFFKLDSVAEKRNKLAKELKYREPGTKAFMKRQARAAFEWVEFTNQTIENAIRLSAFVNARKAGMNIEDAAQLAKNLTVNFNKRGKIGPKLNALYLFYNASIQGSAVMFRALQHKRVQKIAGGIIAAGFMSDVMNAMISDEDDDGQLIYDKIPLWEKESNMIFMLPRGYMPEWLKSVFSYGKMDDVYYIKLPMPYGYRMFHEIGRNTSMATRGAQDASDAGSNILWSIANNFNPIGGTESFLNFIMPTVGDPIIDIMATNKKFTGAPINPPDNPFKHFEGPDSRRFYNSASLESRELAAFINDISGGNEFKPGLIDIHPGTMDHLFQFAVGSAGAFVDRTVNAVGKQFTGEELEIHDIPFARKVLGGNPAWINTTNFYDHKNTLEELYGEWKGFNESGNKKKAAELMDTHGELIRMYGQGTKTPGTSTYVAKKISDIRKQMNYVRNNDDLSSDQKQMRLKKLEEQQSKLVSSFNRKYLEAAGLSASRTRNIISNFTAE